LRSRKAAESPAPGIALKLCPADKGECKTVVVALEETSFRRANPKRTEANAIRAFGR
jgi:hypothetical protein